MGKNSVSFQDVSVETTNKTFVRSSIKDEIINRFSLKKISNPKKILLKDISFEIASGERVGLIGANGSGKTSLLKTIYGVYPASRGVVKVQGSMSAIIELGLGFNENLSGRENIILSSIVSGFDRNFLEGAQEKIIAFSELENDIDEPVKYYSSGMLARLALAVTLLQNNKILILDEIFAVGDSSFYEKSRNYIMNSINQSEITILVSHSENIIREICSRCILLHNGKIVFDGEPESALNEYKKIYE